MNEFDLKAAASSASNRIGQERIDYIKSSYPKEYWGKIEKLANQIDDYANENYENSCLEPCKYNGGFYATHRYR